MRGHSTAANKFKYQYIQMQVIPVIDLKDGQVVAACMGNRDQYKPIRSLLCASSDPLKIINAFLDLHEFSTFYLADLNAITNSGDHFDLIYELTKTYPHIEFWIDSGKQLADLSPSINKNIIPVIGTESQANTDLKSAKEMFILSLDYKAGSPLGNPALFNEFSLWPQRLIVMNLSKIGSNSGPDFSKLQTLIGQHPDKDFIAAGGVRNQHDLLHLAEIGVNHALLASALHSGAVSQDDLKSCRQKNTPLKRGIFSPSGAANLS